MDDNYALMDLTVYGRQGRGGLASRWPQAHHYSVCRRSARIENQYPMSMWPAGRPIAQWSRLAAGRFDDLGRAAE